MTLSEVSKKSTSLIRWGIIGCGAVTEHKSGPAYQQTAGFMLQAVMRRDAAKAADYARRHQIPSWTTDADALIADPLIDAVYIATPPDSHLPYALKVAAAGKICCVEKPMALNYAECQQMHAAFAAAGQPLFVAYYRRSLPRFLQIKQWLAQNIIGPIRHVQWNFSRTLQAADAQGIANWRTDPLQAGGGYFVDLASHGIDLLMFLLGDISQVQGVSTNQQQLYPAEDAVAASWLFQPQADGSQATGSGYWNFAAFERVDQVEIIGQRGIISFAIFDEQPVRLRTATSEQQLVIANPNPIQLPHVANIAAHLAGTLLHPSTGVTAMRTSAVMDQILGKSV